MNVISTSLYTFKNFRDLTESESDGVLQGRNDPQVRHWMTSELPIALDEHQRFVSGLKSNDTAVYVRIERAGCFVGVYSLNEIADGSAVGGFWVTAYARERLLPLNVVFQGMNYMFGVHGIGRIQACQKRENHGAIKLNALLGISLSESNSSYGDGMQHVEITRQHWEQKTTQDAQLLKLMNRMEKLNGTT